MTPVPHSLHHDHRFAVCDATCDFFPNSIALVNAQNRALADNHRGSSQRSSASSQRSSASSEQSFASAPPPPLCSRASQAVLNHGSLNPDQFAHRPSHSRAPRSPGSRSHRSSRVPDSNLSHDMSADHLAQNATIVDHKTLPHTRPNGS
jgi:hypothetical protein